MDPLELRQRPRPGRAAAAGVPLKARGARALTIHWGATASTTLALIVVMQFVGPFVALMWPALALSIAFHEAGHAWFAQRLGFGVDGLVIGIGPTLATAQFSVLPVELRLLPVVGWVEPVVPGSMRQSHSRRVSAHRRMALVFAAGPLASLVLGMTLTFVGMVSLRPQPDAVPHALEVTGSLTAQVVALPTQLVSGELTKLLPPYGGSAHHTVDGAPPERRLSDPDHSDDTRATTIIGFTRQGNSLVHRDGPAMALVLIGLLNLSLAAFNLMPVWGLDGYGVLSELVGTVGVWRPRRQIRARAALQLAGAVCAIGVIMMIMSASWYDLFG